MPFNAYRTSVLARLIKLCSQKLMAIGPALKLVRWAEGKRDALRDAWREHVAVDDAARDLYELATDGE